jgi:hypothetical protein
MSRRNRRGPTLEELIRERFSPRRFPEEKPSLEFFEYVVHLDNQLF